MDLRRDWRNENHRSWPVCAALALNPGRLRVVELLLIDGDPDTRGLDLLDAEDRGLGGCAAMEASILKLLPYALCVCIPSPGTSHFAHTPQSLDCHKHNKKRSDLCRPCHPCRRWPVGECCGNHVERAQANQNAPNDEGRRGN